MQLKNNNNCFNDKYLNGKTIEMHSHYNKYKHCICINDWDRDSRVRRLFNMCFVADEKKCKCVDCLDSLSSNGNTRTENMKMIF